MKKLKERSSIKRISIIVIIMIMLTMMIPTYSDAGIVTIIRKPISGWAMNNIDAFNALLATVFASDAKIKTAKQGIADLQGIGRSEKGFLEKISSGLDEFESKYYDLLLSPDDIFSGRVQVVNANIFSNQYTEDGTVSVEDVNLFNHLMKQLKQTTAGLYYIMRNLAVVILLCLLIYTGIKIVLSSNNAGEKAKWKMHLMDWIKALLLVMFVHVIMIGIFYIADVVTNGLNGALSSGHTIVSKIRMNFDSESELDVTASLVYIIMYLYVTFLTVVFLIAYFKRLFYIIVLVIIAPIVSSLYALGKTSKEIFNKWIKEFTMGVMVQPFHMLIYSVLLLIPMKAMSSSGIQGGNAIQFSTIDTQIYALLAITMIRPIEKYMRRIFGFGQTAIDNVASFESGKKVLDTGVKAAVVAGATIATAGAAAGAIGAAGATGTAAETAGMTKSVATGINGGETMLNSAGEADTLLGSDSSLFNSENPETISASSFDSYMDMPEDTSSYDLFDKFDEEKDEDKDEDKDKDEDEDKDKTLEEDNGKNGNGSVYLENANVHMYNPRGIDSTDKDKEDKDKDKDKDKEDKDKEDKNKLDKDTQNKGTLGGSALARALGGRLGGIGGNLEALRENPYVKAFTSPEMLTQFGQLRDAMHEFTDSLYMPGDATGDWKNNVDIRQEKIKNKKEQIVNQFANNSDNIQKAIEKYGLKDIKNSKTGKTTTAEDQAKAKLKKMEPYVSFGIQDIDKIDVMQKSGMIPKDAMKMYAQNSKENANAKAQVNAFINNINNLQEMRTMVADKMNIPEEQRNNVEISQQINQQVERELKSGTPYIVSGAAKDPETLTRLLDLERKIDKTMNIKGTANFKKTDYIEKADKIIEKAVKNNMGSIKLPGSKNKEDVKQLQDIINQELKDRKNNK